MAYLQPIAKNHMLLHKPPYTTKYTELILHNDKTKSKCPLSFFVQDSTFWHFYKPKEMSYINESGAKTKQNFQFLKPTLPYFY